MKEYRFRTTVTVEIEIDILAPNEDVALKVGLEQTKNYLRLDYKGSIIDRYEIDENHTEASE